MIAEDGVSGKVDASFWPYGRGFANLTRGDGVEFLALGPMVPVRTEIRCFPLHRANEALAALREGRVRGAAVLVT